MSIIEDIFAESFQLQISVPHQSLCIFKAGLSILSEGWAKYKEKVPDVSDSNQNVQTTCNSKLKFIKLKDLFIKKVQKNYSKMIMGFCFDRLILLLFTLKSITQGVTG